MKQLRREIEKRGYVRQRQDETRQYIQARTRVNEIQEHPEATNMNASVMQLKQCLLGATYSKKTCHVYNWLEIYVGGHGYGQNRRPIPNSTKI